MKSKSSIALFIFALCILIAIPIIYYFPQLSKLSSQPEKGLEVFLEISGIAAFSLKFILINLAIFFSAAMVDLFVLGWENSSIKRLFFIRNKSARGDLWCWLLSVFCLYDFFALFFSFGLFYVLSSIIYQADSIKILELIPTAALQFTVLVLLGDLKHYLWHRFMHFMPFWDLHKYHHSAEELNLITTARGHFLEKGFLLIFDSLLFVLLGAPIEFYMAYIILKEFYAQILHSNLNWSLGWVGRHILISPRAHRIHHSNSREYFDKNFGTLFIFWDKLFGTYKDTTEKITIGVENNQYNKKGFWWDMVEGVRAFGISCRRVFLKE